MRNEEGLSHPDIQEDAVSVSASPTTSYDIRSRLDRDFVAACSSQRKVLASIAEGERCGIWKPDGCRDMAQWVAGRLGISYWAASRWVRAAFALERLPGISEALASGVLGIDKVVELTRFATPETEVELIKWAGKVNPATIRRRADKANAPSIEDHQDAHNSRYLRYWYDDLMCYFEGALPLEEGARFVKRVNRLADQMARPASGITSRYQLLARGAAGRRPRGHGRRGDR